MSEDLISLRQEIEKLRAGEEARGPEGVHKTPGQILRKLHELDREPRMKFLGSLLESAHQGTECGAQQHEQALAHAQGQIETIAGRERDGRRALKLVAIYIETLRKNPERAIGQGEVAEKLAQLISSTAQPPDNRCRRVLCGHEWTEAGRTFQCAEPVDADGGHLGEHFAFVREGSAADEELRMQYLEQENAELRRRLDTRG
jgi:hypothetical protein